MNMSAPVPHLVNDRQRKSGLSISPVVSSQSSNVAEIDSSKTQTMRSSCEECVR